jgi:hypothetical protein
MIRIVVDERLEEILLRKCIVISVADPMRNVS